MRGWMVINRARVDQLAVLVYDKHVRGCLRLVLVADRAVRVEHDRCGRSFLRGEIRVFFGGRLISLLAGSGRDD